MSYYLPLTALLSSLSIPYVSVEPYADPTLLSLSQLIVEKEIFFIEAQSLR